MSNKALAYSILIIVIIAAAGFFAWRWNQQKQSQKQFGSQNEMGKEDPSVSVNPTATPESMAKNEPNGVKAEMINNCERKFDAEKLKTAKVEIKARAVEINVKGFGKIGLEFFDQEAPKTVENFLRLANAGYFDCLTFHRVAKGFVIQGGDPKGNGTGGESAFGKTFADEINPASDLYKQGYKKGALAMANSGPDTSGSQFFIMLGDVPLPPNYTIFGRVILGQEVVDKIGQAPINSPKGDGAPLTPVVMESVRIVK